VLLFLVPEMLNLLGTINRFLSSAFLLSEWVFSCTDVKFVKYLWGRSSFIFLFKAIHWLASKKQARRNAEKQQKCIKLDILLNSSY